jgi:hypothetical protein
LKNIVEKRYEQMKSLETVVAVHTHTHTHTSSFNCKIADNGKAFDMPKNMRNLDYNQYFILAIV